MKIYKVNLLKLQDIKEVSVEVKHYKYGNNEIDNLLEDGWQKMTILNYNFASGFERYYCLYNPKDYKPFEKEYAEGNFGIKQMALPWILMGTFKAIGKKPKDFQKLTDLDYYKKIYFFNEVWLPLYQTEEDFEVDYEELLGYKPE